MRGYGCQRRFEPIVFGPHGIAAIDPLEPAHGEMTARHVLEVLDKNEVDGRSTQRADDRDGLRSELLRYDDAKARGDLRQIADEEGRCLADRALVNREIDDLDQT